MISRRNFIKNSVGAGIGIGLLPSLMSCQPDPLFRFAVCADIHKDIMPDADKRLSTFVNVANSYNVDFVVQLGDFCYPEEKNKSFLNIWNSFAKTKYSALGMHDMDKHSKEEVVDYLGIPDTRYSFDWLGFTFIVLDSNFYEDANGVSHDYSVRNFMGQSNLNRIPDIQAEWLKAQLTGTSNRCIVFSHYPLFNITDHDVNASVRRIIEFENKRVGYKKVVASFNGYNHADYTKIVNDIAYVSINSMSHIWAGARYSSRKRFSQLDNKNYPPLKYTMPYVFPLYAIVEIFEDKIKLIGTRSEFMKPTPLDMGMHSREDGLPIRPIVSDMELLF
ncbi:MAG: metallophosphoesterase family protein [Bacteroidales bacterium]